MNGFITYCMYISRGLICVWVNTVLFYVLKTRNFFSTGCGQFEYKSVIACHGVEVCGKGCPNEKSQELISVLRFLFGLKLMMSLSTQLLMDLKYIILY